MILFLYIGVTEEGVIEKFMLIFMCIIKENKHFRNFNFGTVPKFGGGSWFLEFGLVESELYLFSNLYRNVELPL